MEICWEGLGACAPRKFSNSDPLKSLKTCILLVVLASSKFSRRATKLHEKGHFARAFESGGGHVPPVPLVPTSMLRVNTIESQTEEVGIEGGCKFLENSINGEGVGIHGVSGIPLIINSRGIFIPGLKSTNLTHARHMFCFTKNTDCMSFKLFYCPRNEDILCIN